MITKIAICLLALSVFTACQTTQSTASSSRQSLEQRRIASNSMTEPAPPAEGPEDIPGEGPADPVRNPGLLPTPLLRTNAAGGL
jgi:hypothetical protein